MTSEHVHEVAAVITRDAEGKRVLVASGPCLSCGESVESQIPASDEVVFQQTKEQSA